MAYLDDPFKGQLAQLRRDVEKLKRRTTLNSAAIGRSGMEVYDQGVLNISNGTLIVNGYAQISGSLTVSGTSSFSGALTIAGPTGITGALTIQGLTDVTGELNVTGPTKLNGKLGIGGDTSVTGKLDVTGPMATKGTLSVEGVTTLKKDLNITTGGKIKAGNLEIEPAGGGQINFLNGSIGVSTTFGLGIVHTVGVQISSPNTKLTDLPTKTGVTSNIYIDNAGRLWKVG